MNDYAIMMLTCDKYSDIWPIFIGQFKKYWKGYQGSLFINTETTRSIRDDELNIQYSNRTYDSKSNWAGRLKDCLRQIDEEYVILLLDDFAISEEVDVEEIQKCIDEMKKNTEIACFNFRSIDGPSTETILDKYLLADRNADFRINLQAAVWRKSFLLKFIRVHENPWQFETWGTIRARRYKDRIYYLKKDEKSPIEYPGGGIIADGRWREEDTIKWLKSEGYQNIDFPRRNIYHWGDDRATEITHRNFFEKCWQVFKSLI